MNFIDTNSLSSRIATLETTLTPELRHFDGVGGVSDPLPSYATAYSLVLFDTMFCSGGWSLARAVTSGEQVGQIQNAKETKAGRAIIDGVVFPSAGGASFGEFEYEYTTGHIYTLQALGVGDKITISTSILLV